MTDWLEFSRRLQAIARTGLHFARDPYDVERYNELKTLANDMAQTYAGVEPKTVTDLYDVDDGYVTPKVDVRGVVFRDDKILLVREISDGLWTLPGGWADVGDTPAEATEREIREESGYEARAVKLLALYDRRKHDHPEYIYHIYKIYFLCELTGGQAQTSIETSDVGFFAEDEIPPLSIGRVTPKLIRRFFDHYRNPDWPADFD